MEKIFYFCLKKTGNSTEAEDLTQDISFQVLSALNRGIVPMNFSAWVWQIARNRYSVWAKEKHTRNESVTGSDIGDYEIEDNSEIIIDEMIRTEQTALLRRELAFIRGDYRNIIVAYYIENKTVRSIALSLSISESAVEQRLHRARIILKEGMNMAREFGKRSYCPDDIAFVTSGSQPSGLPWKAVKRKIPKNILLQASNNPSTINELSIELGIALPYMEEEIGILCDATLLEKQGNKYITNLFILDKDCRVEIYNRLRESAEERSRLLRAFIEDRLTDIRKLGIVNDSIDDNEVRWWLVPYLLDYLIKNAVNSVSAWDPPKRANGESWGIVGYECTTLPEETGMEHCGAGDDHNNFWAYYYGDITVTDPCEIPEFEDVLLLCDYFRKHLNGEPLSDFEKSLAGSRNNGYAHLSDDGHLVPDIILLTSDSVNRIRDLFREHTVFARLNRNMTEAYASVEKVLKKYSHEVLHKNLGYNIRMELYATRMMAVHDLVENGFLILPDDPGKSHIGQYFELGQP
ncbi:MAG: sigma-70 family RNA polymerase sigma factor [Clostridia bacterium]|nr:sigma-70 family RNA polymerase sigma factor [Clostridia bacterium]